MIQLEWAHITKPIPKARLYFPDGTVSEYTDGKLAYAVWLGLPSDVAVAFRAAGDNRPVYSHDYVRGR